jgi:osmotically-inducible protein OsmY
MVATDRRSTSAQVDDEAIELRIASEADRRWSGAHLNATSFNGIVLLTGEAPSTAVQDEITTAVKGVEHVRLVQNEMAVGEVSDIKSRTNDTYLTGAVKSRLAESSPALAKHVKVVTERSVVYLMGLVTSDEGSSAARIAASTSGVVRVVKIFEYTN